MGTSHTYHGPEIIAAVERALKKVQGGQDKPVTVEVVGDTVVITPDVQLNAANKSELGPGAKLDTIMAKLDNQFGETFRALSK